MSLSKNKLSERLRNIEASLLRLNDMMQFTMTTMRVRVTMNTGLFDPTGQPVPGATTEGTMLDFYKQALAKAANQPVDEASKVIL